jgi:hypothetical protein
MRDMRIRFGRLACGRPTALTTIVVSTVLISGVCLTSAAQPNRNRKGKSSNNAAASRERQQQAIIQAALAQRNAAKQVLAAAESTGSEAQSKLDSALSKLKESAEQFHEAQSTTRHLARDLAKIEDEILEEQKEDSPFGKAAKELEAARNKLKEVEEKTLAQSSAQTQLSGLSGSKLTDARRSILELSPDYLAARTALESTARDFDRVRRELLSSDKDWKATADALTQARKEEKEAEEKTHSGASGRVKNTVTAKNATEAAAAAKAAIAQAEAIIRANGGAKYLTTSNNQPAKKKKK